MYRQAVTAAGMGYMAAIEAECHRTTGILNRARKPAALAAALNSPNPCAMIPFGMVGVEQATSQAQIQRILQSKTFRTSEVHKHLLSYLADKSLAGEADSLKEYTVGLDVFAKPSSYDPRQESTVRMHAARLRQKLAEYYRTEGVDDAVIVDMPKGGFRVTFEPRLVHEPITAAPTETLPPPALYRRPVFLAAALLRALASAGYFGVRLWQLERERALSPSAWTPELRQLWEPMLSSNRPLLVCLSSPGQAQAVSADDLSKGLGTASGAFLLGQFLAQRKNNVVLTRSDELSAPEIAMGDVVFIGPAAKGRQIQASPQDQEFTLEAGGVRVLHPRPGEPEFLADKPAQDPQELSESYALISHVPGLYGTGEVLYLSGNRIASIMAGVQAFTDPTLARTLVAKMKTSRGTVPRYYQIIVKVRAMDEMPVEITYVLHRELPGPGASR